MQSVASGTFTLDQVVQLGVGKSEYLLQFSGPGEFYAPPAREDEEELPPNNVSDDPVAQRCDRMAAIQSADGRPMLTFTQLSLETAAEVLTDPEPLPCVGQVENALLFSLNMIVKAQQPK